VNTEGKRFFDEGEDFEPLLYAKLGRAVLRQPGAIAFQIFDNKVEHLLSPYYADATQVIASSIEELGFQIHIDPVVLRTTIAEFNQAILDVPFNPGIKDGKGTRGITPPKSNWAQPIDALPFRAFPGVCGITFTFGGVRTDGRSRVISKEGQPIPGLYAVGATTGGLLYDHYPLGASLMQAAVFGRIAGREAATIREA
jgi:tricarballylate dehydrogenase